MAPLRPIAAIFPALLLSCANPQGDFDDYVHRTDPTGEWTKGKRGRPVVDSGPVDVAGSDLDISTKDADNESWIGACVPKDVGSPELALMFFVRASFTPDGSGGGMVDKIQFWAMKDSASGKVDYKSQITGAPGFGATNVPMTASGVFNVAVGPGTGPAADISIPGDGQRIGESTLLLTKVVFHMRVTGKDRMCAGLAGTLTAPFKIELSDATDFCVFHRVKDGQDLPTVTPPVPPAVGYPMTDVRCP